MEEILYSLLLPRLAGAVVTVFTPSFDANINYRWPLTLQYDFLRFLQVLLAAVVVIIAKLEEVEVGMILTNSPSFLLPIVKKRAPFCQLTLL